MAVGKIAATTVNHLFQCSLGNKPSIKLINKAVPIMITSFTRPLSTIKITNNLQLLTSDKTSIKITDLKVSQPHDRPLVVLLSWLMAKPKHIHKFANYYIDKGFDVLNVNTSPWQLLWPVKGTQIIADELLNFFYINESYKPIILHGFSVGAYQWGEVLVKIEKNRDHYKNVLNRINGHIWDSAVDYQEINKSVPLVIFPTSVMLQNILRHYLNLHMKVFNKVATQHYMKSSQLFHGDLIKAPALFLLSKSDDAGSVASNLNVKNCWEKSGIQIQWKCWDSSPHVCHYYYHTKEYIEELDKFMQRIGVPIESRK